jgi:hypothetical protein
MSIEVIGMILHLNQTPLMIIADISSKLSDIWSSVDTIDDSIDVDEYEHRMTTPESDDIAVQIFSRKCKASSSPIDLYPSDISHLDANDSRPRKLRDIELSPFDQALKEVSPSPLPITARSGTLIASIR